MMRAVICTENHGVRGAQCDSGKKLRSHDGATHAPFAIATYAGGEPNKAFGA